MYFYKHPICCLTSSSLVLRTLETHSQNFWAMGYVKFWQKQSLWLPYISQIHVIPYRFGFFLHQHLEVIQLTTSTFSSFSSVLKAFTFSTVLSVLTLQKKYMLFPCENPTAVGDRFFWINTISFPSWHFFSVVYSQILLVDPLSFS